MGNAAAAKRYHADEADTITIPPKDQLRTLFKAAAEQDDKGRSLAMVHVTAFGGLRASEVRGLRRKDLRLAQGEITVRQRADQWNVIGPTKTENSRRTVPIPPATVAALKVWLLAAPPSPDNLVFPNGAGKVESYTNIYHRLWTPLMQAAGLADVIPGDGDGQPDTVRPWFALHTLRHVAVSLWIEQDVKAKQIQQWAGHASIKFTLDRYGHLWPNQTAGRAIAQAAEKSLLG
ncbi:MAG: site-specific integrase [Rhodospirillaceae bacterium]|nr:site-specific integrase [Rhodospirillaceae bacterium]